jgi:hypothetical protein
VLLGLALLVVIGPIVANDTAQPASRYSLTASLAEHGSVDLGPYRHRLGVDHAEYRGHLRSDKAPGQPFLGVPAYLVGRAVGAESASHARVRGDLGLWWQTFWSAMVPFAALVALMFLFAARFARRGPALAVALLIGVGTMMLPHGVNLYAHDLAALLGFGAWTVLEPVPISRRGAGSAGLLAAAAVLTEYESGIVLLVLAGYLIVRQRSRIGAFVVGALAPLGALAGYQWIAFGAPWHTPSSYYAGTINGTSDGGYTIPGVHEFVQVVFGYRGLVVGAPIALVGLVAAVWLTRKGEGRLRVHGAVALAVFVPYLVLCAGWSGLPILEEPGPRYLIPALPFLAVPLAALWDRLWRPMLLASLVGAAISIPTTFTFILLRIHQPPYPELLDRVRDRRFVPTLWSIGLGRFGVALYGATIVAAIVAVVRAARREPDAEPVAEQVFASPIGGR